MKKVYIIITVFLSLVAVSCGVPTGNMNSVTSSGTKLTVITTIAPLYSMVLNVGGPYVEVHNLVPVGVSEHTYQAKPSDIALLTKADLIVKNGVHLELFLDGMLENVPKTHMVVDTSSGITLLTGVHHGHEEEHEEEGHVEEEEGYDPHIWLSIPNALMQVDTITEALQKKDPVHAKEYAYNAQIYKARLEQLHQKISTELGSVTKKPYMVFHNGFQYFEKAYGLKATAVVQDFPGKDPSAQDLKNLHDTIREKNIQAAFVEPQFSPRVVTQLAQTYHMYVGELDTMGMSLSSDGYEQLLQKNAEAFLIAFRQ